MNDDARKSNVRGNGVTDAVFIKRYDGHGVTIHDRLMPDMKARFAMELLRVHAGVTAQLEGEDSTGRARLRRDTSDEAVAYACATAEAAFAEFTKRGWLIEIPAYEEVIELARPEN